MWLCSLSLNVRTTAQSTPPFTPEKQSDVGGTFIKAISKAFSALYIYDYLLTIGDEVRFVAPCVVGPVSERDTGAIRVEGT